MSRLEDLLNKTLPNGIYVIPQLVEGLSSMIESNGFREFFIDCQEANDKHSLFFVVSAAMRFPSWFGRNWDAFWDCLIEVCVNDKPNIIIVINYENFATGSPEEFSTFIDILGKSWPAELLSGEIGYTLFIGPFSYLPEGTPRLYHS